MNLHNKEIYASLEIRDHYLNFIVIFYDNSGEYNVLFEKHIESNFSENGVIINAKLVAKEVTKIIEEANQQLYIKIQKIGLVLPDSNLQIFRNVKTKRFKNEKIITKEDILNLVSDYEKIYVPNNQIILSIKPYAYLIDNLEKTKQLSPPIGKNTDCLTVKSLVYTIDLDMYQSHLNILKLAKLKLLSITTKSYSLGYSTGAKTFKNPLVIIDWNDISVNISIFIKERLTIFKSFSDLGINNFIDSLKSLFKTDSEKVKKYIYNVLNSDVLDSTKNFNIYNNLDENKNLIKVSMKELINEFTKYCDKVFNEINDFLLLNINSENNDKINNILFTGEILKINDFKKMSNINDNLKYKLYKLNLIGGQDIWTIPVIGNIFYQRIINKLQNNLITSI